MGEQVTNSLLAGGDLIVYRERLGSFEKVGRLRKARNALQFAYEESYLTGPTPQAISHALPLSTQPLATEAVISFFDGILPEGSIRRSLSRSFHANMADTQSLIMRLNNESAGALVFKAEGEHPVEGRGYLPLEDEDLLQFACAPREFAPRAMVRSRLSLAGAQMKVGLYRDKSNDCWCYPMGTAPSSHIIKACDGTFPNQTLNEAVCMGVASALGFETASCQLIAVEGCEPLLAIERFDRKDVGDIFPHRLHQEDFLQAIVGLTDKYEPTDGAYANHCGWLIGEESLNPFGDRMLFFSRLLLDWAVGNADNHLKNHSLLWSEDWSGKELSPLYDITCTTIYPEVDREMGVSFGQSRRIDQVTADDVMATAKACSVGRRFASKELKELLEKFPTALRMSAENICNQGFPEAEAIADKILKSFEERRNAMMR